MSEKIRTLVPGEQLAPGKPWLRRIGDRVIRYVRSAAESPAMLAMRGVDADGSLAFTDRLLSLQRDRVEQELDLLENIGVPVISRSVEIDWVPVFQRDGKAEAYQRGIKIETPFLDGARLDRYQPRLQDQADDLEMQLATIYTALGEYVEYKAERQEPFLGDILGAQQYLAVNNETPFPDVTLIDIDPIFAAPTGTNYNRAFVAIHAARQALAASATSLQ